jgi:hypothetical protein
MEVDVDPQLGETTDFSIAVLAIGFFMQYLKCLFTSQPTGFHLFAPFFSVKFSIAFNFIFALF